jgi:hypothetical protein
VNISVLKPLRRGFGPEGPYYEADYELAACFGPELSFGLIYDDEVLGGVTAKYM